MSASCGPRLILEPKCKLILNTNPSFIPPLSEKIRLAQGHLSIYLEKYISGHTLEVLLRNISDTRGQEAIGFSLRIWGHRNEKDLLTCGQYSMPPDTHSTHSVLCPQYPQHLSEKNTTLNDSQEKPHVQRDVSG